jgi:cysteine sulfinate desulfinase/cysteine desulfurase-like protein
MKNQRYKVSCGSIDIRIDINWDEAERESHVIQAMTRGTKHAWATLSTIRISLGKGTRRADVKRIVQAITDARAVGSIQK